MVARVGFFPVFATKQLAPAETSFSQEKITRVVLRTLAVGVLCATVLLSAHILVGNLSIAYIIPALALLRLRVMVLSHANNIHDLTDPRELREMQEKVPGLSMTEMLQKFSVETILRYKLASVDHLRVRCCTDLLGRIRGDSVPVLRRHADSLLKQGIITSAVHQALVADDVEALKRLLPNNTVDLGKMFK